MSYTYLGENLENIWYFREADPFDATSLAALNTSIASNWATTMQGHLSSGCNLDFIESTALDTDTGAQDTLAVGSPGAITGTGLPGSVTVAVKFATGLAGRSNRGRTYWPGLAESQISGNELNSAVATAIVSDLEDLFAGVESDVTAEHVIVSYCHDNAWRTTAVSNLVTSYLLVNNDLDNQRRRLAGRGV